MGSLTVSFTVSNKVYNRFYYITSCLLQLNVLPLSPEVVEVFMLVCEVVPLCSSLSEASTVSAGCLAVA